MSVTSAEPNTINQGEGEDMNRPFHCKHCGDEIEPFDTGHGWIHVNGMGICSTSDDYAEPRTTDLHPAVADQVSRAEGSTGPILTYVSEVRRMLGEMLQIVDDIEGSLVAKLHAGLIAQDLFRLESDKVPTSSDLIDLVGRDEDPDDDPPNSLMTHYGEPGDGTRYHIGCGGEVLWIKDREAPGGGSDICMRCKAQPNEVGLNRGSTRHDEANGQ